MRSSCFVTPTNASAPGTTTPYGSAALRRGRTIGRRRPGVTSSAPMDYVQPLVHLGLRGRMLHVPGEPGRDREILLVYGHHALLERWWGLVQVLSEYGTVTMPDMPGFGGMESFYRIGRTPSIDEYADFLAAVVERHYRNRRFTIFGISLGFVVATRMLQRHPTLVNAVDLIASVSGWVHHDDLRLPGSLRQAVRQGSRLLSLPFIAPALQRALFNGPSVRAAYNFPIQRSKTRTGPASEHRRRLADLEVRLWKANDMRTHWATFAEIMALDNRNCEIGIPVWQVYISGDSYLDNDAVRRSLLMIYSDCYSCRVDLAVHAPSGIDGKDVMAALVPPRLAHVLHGHHGKPEIRTG